MGYAERVMLPGETVALRARLHWVLLAPGAILTAVSALLPIAAGVLTYGEVRVALIVVSAVAFVAGGYQLLRAWLQRMSTEIIVSTRRIIVKTGLVARHTLEMTLDKIESVQINQGVFGRLLDYGTVTIRGVGAGLEPIAWVAAPLELQKSLNLGR